MEETVDHSERSHAKTSPSQQKNFALCPSYEPYPDDGTVHPVTASGTRVHEALETGDVEGLDETELAMWNFCVDYYEEHRLPEAVGYDEKKLFTGHRDVYGFADKVEVIVAGDRAAVFDWKCGFGKIDEVAKNWQSKSYSLGVFMEYPQVREIEFHFVLARFQEAISYTFRVGGISRLRMEVYGVADRHTELKGKVHKMDPAVCEWCGVKAECPAFTRYLTDLVEHPGYDEKAIDPREEDSPERWSFALGMVPAVERWAKDVKGFALAKRVEDGMEIPGYSLREKRTKAAVKDHKALVRTARAYGLSSEEVFEASTVSLKQIKDKLSEKTPKGQKKARVADFDERLEREGTITYGETTYLQKDRNSF